MIRGLTIKELLIAVTNNVTQDNIQDDPFLVSANLSHCPQPYQLSELYMDDCAPLANFDYYTESRWQFPFLWALVFIFVGATILCMLLIAVYNQARRKAILSTGRSQRVRKVEGVDLTDSSGDIVVVTEDCAGISGPQLLGSTAKNHEQLASSWDPTNSRNCFVSTKEAWLIQPYP